MTHLSKFAAFLLPFALVFPAALTAQGVLAEIHGIVTDSTGSVIPTATIVVTDETKGWKRTIKANPQGEYTLPELETDLFSLAVDAPGFREAIRKGIRLQTGEQARVDFSLLTGEAADSVTVEADASLVQASDATLGDVVDQRKIVELPLNGRQFFQLAQLIPNVFPPIPNSALAFRGGFNVSGQPEVNNDYLLDGIDNADEATMQPTVSPSVEDIQEFKLLTGVYTAEYGRFSGGQILITTRSGGNAIHGSAYEFYRNSFLDAKQYFSPGSVPSFTRNQYGVAIGGPIVKDHTFYFGTYEGLRLNQPVALAATVPTLLERAGNFSELSPKTVIRNPRTGLPYANNTLPALDSVAAQLLSYYPLPTANGVTNNYTFSEIRNQRQDQFSLRVDQTLWAKNTIFAAYQYQNLNAFEPSNSLCGSAQIPNFGCNTPELDQAIAIHDTQIVGSSMVNEFRIGYNRIRTNRALEDAKYGNVLATLGIPTSGPNGVGDQTGLNMGVPRVTISGYATLGGATNLPQGRRDNTYNVIDSFSWVKGKHSLKFGGDYKHFIYNLQYYQDGRGIFNFTGQFTSQALADFELGNLLSTTRDPGDPGVHSLTTSSDFFAMDQYHVSPRLTLTYGLRYELDFPEGERNNRIANYDPTSGNIIVADGRLLNLNPATGTLVQVGTQPLLGKIWNLRTTNLAPRVSLAYQPFGTKTTLRAGYGIFYNQVTAGNGISQLWRGLPFRTLQTFTNPNSNPTSSPIKPTPTVTWQSPFPSGVTNAGGFTPAGINQNYHTANVQQWSLAIDRELSKDLALEINYLGSHGSHLQESFNINQPTPAPGTVQARRPFNQWGAITYVDSTGNSSYNSISAQLTRRYSAGLTLLASYTYAHSLDDAPYSGFIQNFRNLGSQYASSDFDIRNRSVTSFTYELPFGTKKPIGASLGALPRAAISGWQVNGILSFQSGLPFTVTTTKDPGNVGLTTGYANLVAGQSIQPVLKTPLTWFNTAAFTGASITTPGTYALGNSSRNLLTGGNYNDLDFGVYRNVPLHDRIHLELRAEIFNSLNHPSFGIPTNSIDSSSAGAFSTTSSTARQTQFAAKVLF